MVLKNIILFIIRDNLSNLSIAFVAIVYVFSRTVLKIITDESLTYLCLIWYH